MAGDPVGGNIRPAGKLQIKWDARSYFTVIDDLLREKYARNKT